jgi:D-mannonate dehydratase
MDPDRLATFLAHLCARLVPVIAEEVAIAMRPDDPPLTPQPDNPPAPLPTPPAPEAPKP